MNLESEQIYSISIVFFLQYYDPECVTSPKESDHILSHVFFSLVLVFKTVTSNQSPASETIKVKKKG